MAKQPANQPVRRLLTPSERELVNRHSVEAMTAIGASEADIADYLNLPVKEMQALYSIELKYGAKKLRYGLEISLAAKAKAGDLRATLAWLKQYAGWTEVTRRELTGKDGGPITIRNLDAPSLDRLIITLRQAEAAERRHEGGGHQALAGGSGRIIDLEPLSGPADEGSEE